MKIKSWNFNKYNILQNINLINNQNYIFWKKEKLSSINTFLDCDSWSTEFTLRNKYSSYEIILFFSIIMIFIWIIILIFFLIFDPLFIIPEIIKFLPIFIVIFFVKLNSYLWIKWYRVIKLLINNNYDNKYYEFKKELFWKNEKYFIYKK